jgi:hypothetical protein
VARTRSGHDTGSITARSVDEVAPIRHVISHYAPVLIASLSIHWRSEKIADLESRKRCADNNRPLPSLSQTVPNDIAANLFNSVGAVEISEYREPNSPILTARQCPS